MNNPLVNSIFTSFQDHINNEQDIREEIRTIIKEIEKIARNMLTILQIIHQEQKEEGQVIHSCAAARELFKDVRTQYEKLAQIIPKDEYYRYNDHWRFVTQRLSFLAALIVFLEAGILIDHKTVAEILGVQVDRTKGFHLDLEDYLMGLLQLSSELARFAVNAATNRDYNRPLQIAKFVGELNAGFRLLNLKNDSLRKRFDALKYDVKKIEEVVYDLSIRGLKPGSTDEEQSGMQIEPTN